jgi:hypothetical protein
MQVLVETCAYTRVLLRKGAYTFKIMSDLGRTTEKNLSSLFVVVFLSVGHYPYYGSLDFIIIKSSQYCLSPWDFFQGYLPKNISVYVCMIFFPILFLLSLFELNIPTVYFCFVCC